MNKLSKGKPIIALIIISILVISIFSVSSATSTFTITVGNGSANAGSTAGIQINLSNVPVNGLASFTIRVSYDNTKFSNPTFTASSLVKNPVQDITTSNTGTDTGLFLITYFESSFGSNPTNRIKTAGLYGTLNFTVNSQCPNGSYLLTAALPTLDPALSWSSAGSTITWNEISTAINNFSINVGPVTSPSPGQTASPASGTPTPSPTQSPTPTPDVTQSPTPTSVPTTDYVVVLKVGNANMTVDGTSRPIDPVKKTVPYLIGNDVLIPVRAVVEALGGTLEVDPEQQSTTIDIHDRITEIWTNKQDIYIAGIQRKMSSVPQYINGKLYMPLPIASMVLGSIIQWDKNSREITITY